MPSNREFIKYISAFIENHPLIFYCHVNYTEEDGIYLHDINFTDLNINQNAYINQLDTSLVIPNPADLKGLCEKLNTYSKDTKISKSILSKPYLCLQVNIVFNELLIDRLIRIYLKNIPELTYCTITVQAEHIVLTDINRTDMLITDNNSKYLKNELATTVATKLIQSNIKHSQALKLSNKLKSLQVIHNMYQQSHNIKHTANWTLSKKLYPYCLN